MDRFGRGQGAPLAWFSLERLSVGHITSAQDEAVSDIDHLAGKEHPCLPPVGTIIIQNFAHLGRVLADAGSSPSLWIILHPIGRISHHQAWRHPVQAPSSATCWPSPRARTAPRSRRSCSRCTAGSAGRLMCRGRPRKGPVARRPPPTSTRRPRTKIPSGAICSTDESGLCHPPSSRCRPTKETRTSSPSAAVKQELFQPGKVRLRFLVERCVRAIWENHHL